MNKILSAFVALMMPVCAFCGIFSDGMTYDLRSGYAVGGTAPVNMPSSIRSLSRYSLRPNFSLGFDAHKSISGKFGVMAGLRVENKGMEIDARVKNYHMEIVRGGESLEGNFTGHNVTKVRQLMLTLPVMGTYRLGSRLMIKFGPYVSMLLSKDFSGYASDGYLRVGNPTGPKVEIGDTPGTRGTYDFKDEMRRMQYGLVAGADITICRRWGAYADISWGLTGVHNSGFKTIEQTLYPIYGTIGVVYKLK